jgi:hypothetical protein
MRKVAVVATILFLGASSFALGQTATMSPDDVKKKAEAAGYTMVENIKPAGNGYTAVAMKGGKMINIKIDKDGKVEAAK